MTPGFAFRWGLRHPVQSSRESYLWARNESRHGRVLSALLVPYNWLAFAGVLA